MLKDLKSFHGPPIPEARYEVKVQSNITYGHGLTCAEDYTNCSSMDLMGDIYLPYGKKAQRPSVILVHGGMDLVGWKGEPWVVNAANFYASRGFVAFAIDFRLLRDRGPFPCAGGACGTCSGQDFARKFCLLYPAVRDFKAAVRFLRASAHRFNLDPQRIAAAGGSAGATNILLAAVTAEDAFKSELLYSDPTLVTTHLKRSSSVRAAVLHWPFPKAIDAYAATVDHTDGPTWASVIYHDAMPAILEFHGSADDKTPVKMSFPVQTNFSQRKVPYELVVMEDCGHRAWCGNPFRDGRSCTDDHGQSCKECQCSGRDCSLQHEYATRFLMEHLGLQIM